MLAILKVKFHSRKLLINSLNVSQNLNESMQSNVLFQKNCIVFVELLILELRVPHSSLHTLRLLYCQLVLCGQSTNHSTSITIV